MMFWYGGHWVFWQAALMWLVMVAFWGLMIWLVYTFVVAVIRDSRRQGPGDSAKAILDERLARGEIDAEEYRRLRDVMVLDQHTPVGTGDRR
jgi:putative membrane protein